MKDQIPLNPGPYDSDPDDEFLVKHDACIQAEARKAVPSDLFPEDVLHLETDELAQNIRIKLWASRQKRSITYPKAYIRVIAHTAAVDMVRSHRSNVSLSGDVDGEPYLCDLLVARNEGFQDPAYEIEVRGIDPDLLTKLAKAILALPPQQRQAMLFALKNRRYDAFPLINALKAYGVDIEAEDWPEEEHEVQLLRASLAVARKKLQWILAEFMTV
jgi:DNA-directed RNA polymerase specialized sigma24 family protein